MSTRGSRRDGGQEVGVLRRPFANLPSHCHIIDGIGYLALKFESHCRLDAFDVGKWKHQLSCRARPGIQADHQRVHRHRQMLLDVGPDVFKGKARREIDALRRAHLRPAHADLEYDHPRRLVPKVDGNDMLAHYSTLA
jgi:hypothetical protein